MVVLSALWAYMNDCPPFLLLLLFLFLLLPLSSGVDPPGGDVPQSSVRQPVLSCFLSPLSFVPQFLSRACCQGQYISPRWGDTSPPGCLCISDDEGGEYEGNGTD